MSRGSRSMNSSDPSRVGKISSDRGADPRSSHMGLGGFKEAVSQGRHCDCVLEGGLKW